MFKILLLLFARTTILIGGRLGHSAIFFTGGMPLKEIKTKPEGGKPKLLDKAAKAPKTAMKDLWLKSKDKSISELKETPFASQRGESSNAPANTAGDQMLSGMETAAKKGANLTYRGGKKLAQATARKVKEKREISRTLSGAKDAGGKAVKNTSSKIRTKNTVAKTIKGKPQKAVKTASRSVKGVKQSAKRIKTAQRSAKTAQQAAKAAQKTAQATAKAAKAAAQAAKAAAKAAVTGIKVAVKATAAAIKATIAAIKGLIALIAAGGWVAVVIILLICLIALIVGSCFGLFFGSDSTGTGTSVTQAVSTLNGEYLAHIQEIGTPPPMTGWKPPLTTGNSPSIGRTSSLYFPPRLLARRMGRRSLRWMTRRWMNCEILCGR